MKNFRSYLKLVPAGIMLAVCGCSLLPEPRQSDIEYYDLKPPAAIRSVPVDVEQFATFTGERQRMMYRKNEISVRGSDFYKWVQSPGAMLTRYLRLAFRHQLKAPAINRERTVVISGEVLTFENRSGSAVLGVRFHLKHQRRTFTKTVVFEVKMKDRSPAAFSEAMSTAAERFAQMAAAEAGRISSERK